MSVHACHRWHIIHTLDKGVHGHYEECICGATRRCTGKPGEYTYTQNTGERTKLAGRCVMREDAERAIARLGRLTPFHADVVMKHLLAEIDLLECWQGLKESGLSDEQIRQEFINAGHIKEKAE